MSRSERLKQVEEEEAASARRRSRLGLSGVNPREAEVRDWMASRGAVPVTLACAALVVYLLVSLVLGLI